MTHHSASGLAAVVRVVGTGYRGWRPGACRIGERPAQADEYRSLAKAIDGNDMFIVPTPMATEAFETLLMDFGIAD